MNFSKAEFLVNLFLRPAPFFLYESGAGYWVCYCFVFWLFKHCAGGLPEARAAFEEVLVEQQR